MSELDARVAEAAKAVEEAEALVLACHIGPDGDALGSMLAVAAAAQREGKEVFPSFGEPFTLPRHYRFLPTDLLVPPGEVPSEPEVMLCFDTGSADRLGELARVASAASTVVVLDHHISNTGFGDIDLVVADAAATAEVAILLIDALGWEVDPVVATCLHTGLVTDTGRFSYSNTGSGTLRLAARLVEAGAQPEVISQHVYEESPFGAIRVTGAVLSRAELESERRLVWSVLTPGDLEENGIGLDDTDHLIDALRVAEESDVAVLLKQVDAERLKVSLRSRGRVDVGAIAVELGGGGHHNAAGVTLTGVSPSEAISRIRDLLPTVGEDG